MTVEELSQLRWLKKEIWHQRKKLDEIDGKTVESQELKHIIEDNIKKLETERLRAEIYIQDIPDSLARQIIRLRFVDGKSWRAIAMIVGGGNTESSVKKICYRKLSQMSRKNIV